MYWHTRVVTVTVAQNKPAHFSIRMHSLGSNEVIMKSLHTRPLYLTRALPSCFVTLPRVVYQSYIYEYANVQGGVVCRTRKPRFSFVDTFRSTYRISISRPKNATNARVLPRIKSRACGPLSAIRKTSVSWNFC